MLSAIQQSSALKQRLIRSTSELVPGSRVRCGGRTVEIESTLGSGLVGSVYRVRELGTGRPLALKHARANFSFFREALRVEREVAERVGSREDSTLRSVAVVASNAHMMLKELCTAPTLQRLLFNGSVSHAQRAALEQALVEAALLWENERILLDLSPKNVCWDGDRWLLVDSGPKLHRSPFETVLETCRWSDYFAYVESKVRTEISEPSALSVRADDDAVATVALPALVNASSNAFSSGAIHASANASTHALPNTIASSSHASTWVFVRDWWGWYPEDPAPDLGYFLVTVDDGVVDDEAILVARSTGAGAELERSFHPWADHPLVRRVAARAWQALPGMPDAPPGLDADPDALPVGVDSEPVSWGALVGGVLPMGLGLRLKQLEPDVRSSPQPSLVVRPYAHWKDLADPSLRHSSVDLFCHEPLAGRHVVLRPELDVIELDLPGLEPWQHARLEIFGHSARGRAVLLVPGFRADCRAAYPLVRELCRAGIEAQWIVAHLGARNPDGQLLVTAGQTETMLLWDILEYALTCLDLRELQIVAASHGAIGAWQIACLHPAATKIVLDSPLLRPMDVISSVAQCRGEDLSEVRATLAAAGLPHRSYELFTRAPSTLQVLTLRPERDEFAELCGSLPVGRSVIYNGRHASTLRHDAETRGIPAECVRAITDFLGA